MLPVDVQQVDLGLPKELREVPPCVAVRTQQRAQSVQLRGDRALHPLEDVLLRALLELEDAAGRQAPDARLEGTPGAPAASGREARAGGGRSGS